jgi:coenzyme PQQ precursor peptide PqqA
LLRRREIMKARRSSELHPLIGVIGAGRSSRRGMVMTWTTPTLVEICIGLEINGYLPAEL